MPAGKGRAEHARLEDFKAQEVSNVTHAFAKLGIYNTDVLEVLSSKRNLYLLQSMGNHMVHGVLAVTRERAVVFPQHTACGGNSCQHDVPAQRATSLPLPLLMQHAVPLLKESVAA